MIIKSVKGKKIKDSRGDFTIEVSIDTDVGKFKASAPNGKSKGKYEAKSYKKTIEGDIENLEKISDYFSEEYLEKFNDLRRIEDIVKGHIGANTLFALESAALKAMAQEQKKEIWEIINPNATMVPRLVGNCIGGGLHSKLVGGKRPDFQEFLLISRENSVIKGFDYNKKAKEKAKNILKKSDSKFKEGKNDENAWMTSLNEKEILDVLNQVDLPLGIDIAASGFYKRKKYHYKNPPLDRTADEQLMYVSNLMKNYPLIYVEDPFDEEDFESHKKLLEKNPNIMVVGDDLTVTNYKRLEKAIEMKAINALIMKPNQNGSLIDVKRVAELAKKKNIKMIFSHRSGETMESILADLAFGFEADFIKCGITGDVREVKIKRLIEIEKSLGKK
jgi:enolase